MWGGNAPHGLDGKMKFTDYSSQIKTTCDRCDATLDGLTDSGYRFTDNKTGNRYTVTLKDEKTVMSHMEGTEHGYFYLIVGGGFFYVPDMASAVTMAVSKTLYYDRIA